jgi:hypothetical protein
MAYTSPEDLNLVVEDFVTFYKLIFLHKSYKDMHFLKYLDLTHFLISWYVHKREKGILFVGPKHIPLLIKGWSQKDNGRLGRNV